MRKVIRFIVAAFLLQFIFHCPIARAQAAKAAYPAMAPLDQYMMDKEAEIALARSAAPPSISGQADVMVLGKDGYAIAAKGSNGFLCLVERSWAKATEDAEFWNPKMRAPNCFNAAAARSYEPIFFLKTNMVLAGKSKAEIHAAVESGLDKKELPALEPGSMCYMMSKQQYLSDRDMSWHPHVMFFAAGKVAKTWGANLDGSPIVAGVDPEARVTVFMVLAGNWSDGTAAPMM